MKRNNWFVPVLLLAGIGLIVFSLWAPNSQFNFGLKRNSFAKVVEIVGQVKIQNDRMSSEAVLNKDRINLDALDSLRTSRDSEVVVEFQNGSQVRLAEKSEALLDALDNGQPLVVIRSGEIFIEKFGETDSFWVRSNGQLYSASDYILVDKKSGSKLSSTDSKPERDRSQITQLEIETTLNAKKSDFFKCFGQLIQKTPQASGQVLLSFTIEQKGNTSKIEVSQTEIQDSQFKSCLAEVVARTRFKSFSGNPIATVFPIRFE